MKKQSEK